MHCELNLPMNVVYTVSRMQFLRLDMNKNMLHFWVFSQLHLSQSKFIEKLIGNLVNVPCCLF